MKGRAPTTVTVNAPPNHVYETVLVKTMPTISAASVTKADKPAGLVEARINANTEITFQCNPPTGTAGGTALTVTFISELSAFSAGILAPLVPLFLAFTKRKGGRAAADIAASVKREAEGSP